MPGTLVIAEVTDAGVAPASYELVGAARKLADAGAGPVSAFIAGSEEQAKDLIAHGADTVYVSSAAEQAEVLVPAVKEALDASGAEIVLMAQSSLGRDLGPKLAFATNSGVAMDSTDLRIEGGRLRATRSAYGGNARAEHTWKANPQIATVKAKTFDPLPADASRSGDIKTVSASGNARIRVLGTEKAVATGIRLEDAGIVVSGGRGLGDPSGFQLLEQLAALLPSAAVGTSRAAADLGWYPPAQQVGLTGKTVSPNLYIAVAISGASQHMAGMSGSKNIVSINKDADANMVKVSKFAVIEDYKKIVPALIEEIKKLG